MNSLVINNRLIGPGQPIYVVAEMSANHNQELRRALDIVKAARNAGANAIKLQTYTADTMTIDCKDELFRIKGTLWDGATLYDLYSGAYIPWEWHSQVKEAAESVGLDFFSSPFDETAVDFLERMNVPVYKVASSEIVDIPLLRKIGATRKPIIMSTGMASKSEIEEAIHAIRAEGGNQLALLKCSSVYPAPHSELNLRGIAHLGETFDIPVGLSDHTLGMEAAVAAAALGACIIEKHITLRRADAGPDAAFSMEPEEFEGMVSAVRNVEKALGSVFYGPTESERTSITYRRSLFVVDEVRAGEKFTNANVRSIRPGHGLHPRYLNLIVGRTARCNLKRGTPLRWDMIEGPVAEDHHLAADL